MLFFFFSFWHLSVSTCDFKNVGVLKIRKKKDHLKHLFLAQNSEAKYAQDLIQVGANEGTSAVIYCF